MSNGYPNPRVNTLIYDTPATADFTKKDWLDGALAFLDQAGVPAALYDRIKALLPDLEPDHAEACRAAATALRVAQSGRSEDVAAARRALLVVAELPAIGDIPQSAFAVARSEAETINARVGVVLGEWAKKWDALAVLVPDQS